MNEYTLSREEAALIAELQTAISALQQQLEGACKLIIRQQSLGDGNWSLNGDKLVRVDPPKQGA